jgi:hypothetical protein
LIAALSGLWVAQFYPWPEVGGEAVYVERLIAGTATTLAIVRGLWPLRNHDYVAHGIWMMRGDALGMSAGTQGLTHLPWFIFVGRPGETSRAVLMALRWIIDAIVAEYVIRKRLMQSVAPTPQAPRGTSVRRAQSERTLVGAA